MKKSVIELMTQKKDFEHMKTMLFIKELMPNDDEISIESEMKKCKEVLRQTEKDINEALEQIEN